MHILVEIAGKCEAVARAASGHAAALPSNVMNSCGFMPDMGFSPTPCSGFPARLAGSTDTLLVREVEAYRKQSCQL
jgi:hypothetical protein